MKKTAIGMLLVVILCFGCGDGNAEENEEKELQTMEETPVQSEAEKMNPDQWVEGHVTGVSFDHGVTQEDILKIAGLKNLKHLDIAISDTEQDIDLSPLGSLTELQELSIYFYTEPDHVDLSFIKKLHNLKSVFIDRCTEGLDLSLFENLVYLQELRVAYMDDVDLSCLANCKNLREVHIVGEHIRNLDGITGAAYLRTLYLCDNTRNRNSDDETPIDLHALSSMSKLEELYLVDIDVADVTPISELGNLGYLVLSNTGIQDVEALRNLESLYNLEIFGNKSEKVKEQVEMYMKHVETVTVTEEIPYGF